ncbi:helix-turn-helix domain-containing protein [Alkalibacterium subtropicum]|uniref:helix-turn-helix domain-containing protein n=1 Tax=Alkalibacterium subtropicum TaxID=753702 RepID=UPI003CCC1109
MRLSLGFTQLQVCRNIMSQSNYSKVEKGEIDISFSKMVELLNRLDMSVDEFMYIKNDYKKHTHSQISKLKKSKI